MQEDIRDKLRLNHGDILRLNFVRSPGIFFFRRHHRFGLRSHIMEVLNPADLKKEKNGVTIAGLKHFPKATPLKMLRVFRKRFESLKKAEHELKSIKIAEKFLWPDHIAKSDEFLVHYELKGKYQILLCGLQEYVEGEVIDPWSHLDEKRLVTFLHRMGFQGKEDPEWTSETWITRVREKADEFIFHIKQMILRAELIPDLAGVGNLILMKSGNIKLVDINNISKVPPDHTVPLDDRGYPVCDKSIEALSLLEYKIVGTTPDKGDPIYTTFLDTQRIKEVKEAEKRFHLSVREDCEGPGSGQYIPH